MGVTLAGPKGVVSVQPGDKRTLLEALRILKRAARDDHDGAVEFATEALLTYVGDAKITSAYRAVLDTEERPWR